MATFSEIKMAKMLLYILVSLSFIIMQKVNSASATSTYLSTTTNVPITLPCPCEGQPEGVVIPHPFDCRAYYTCLGGKNVQYNKCENRSHFFHPYIRSCVQRSTYVSFIPDFIPTKDVCKITAVFPAPAMEHFDNCNIKADESMTDQYSDEIVASKNSNTNSPVATTIPGLDSILSLLPWRSTRSMGGTTTTSPDSFLDYTTEASYQYQTLQTPGITTTTSPPMNSKTENCKVTKIDVHHFPGPCKADVTCESGTKLTIDKCQSSLSLV